MDHHGSTSSPAGTAPGRTPATAAPTRDFAHDPWVWRTFPGLRALACVVELPTPLSGGSSDGGDTPTPLRTADGEHLRAVHDQDDRPAESLVRRLRTRGDLPRLDPLVDLGNALSVRWAVPVAVVYGDDAGHAHSRRWCWRQSTRSVITPQTRRALVVAEALHAGSEDDLDELAAALVEALGRVDVSVEPVVLHEGAPALVLPAADGTGRRS